MDQSVQANIYVLLIFIALYLVLFVCRRRLRRDEDDRADQPLPSFPYAAQPQSDKPSETLKCAICLEPLKPGQLCSEVPSCGHVLHGDCLGQWARSNGSCPLCRAKIVPGSDEVAIADDMV